MDLSDAAYDHCQLCPRRCGARRSQGISGVCGCTSQLRVARAALHFWEEPPISGESGSGAIFFSGCPLRCVFCQNVEISQGGHGFEVSTSRLAAQMLELEAQGALNINLVTPLHFAPHVTAAVKHARELGLTLPICCNTSGYERADLVDALADVVDIWLTDYKYASGELAARMSGAPDYPEVAHLALEHMVAALKRRGGRSEDEDGRMLRGIIVRHLVLPGHVDDSLAVIDTVRELAGDVCDLSIMNQYTPNERMRETGGAMAGPLDEEDYDLCVLYADNLGFDHLWWQQAGTVDESFVPAFDATGVFGPEA